MLCKQVLEEVRNAAELDEERRSHLLALAHVEAALIKQMYGVNMKAEEHLTSSQEALGFSAELTGE